MDNRIDVTLRKLRESGETALAPYVTIGYPDLETCKALAETILNSGAHMLELGIPFSDPLADGPTIQKTSFQALQQGTTLATAMDVLAHLRRKTAQAPLIFMGYYNPFLRYGIDRFIEEAAAAGLDGIIVPDLPFEEAGRFQSACDAHGIYLIPLLAPTSTDQRIAQSCKEAKGFIYCVSLTGVTGARRELSSKISDLVARIRRHTDLPVLVGFGVSRREHVEEIGRFADGAVVASALLDAIDKSPEDRVLETAADMVRSLTTSEGGIA